MVRLETDIVRNSSQAAKMDGITKVWDQTNATSKFPGGSVTDGTGAWLSVSTAHWLYPTPCSPLGLVS